MLHASVSRAGDIRERLESAGKRTSVRSGFSDFFVFFFFRASMDDILTVYDKKHHQ
jgi:hypothetical protein